MHLKIRLCLTVLFLDDWDRILPQGDLVATLIRSLIVTLGCLSEHLKVLQNKWRLAWLLTSMMLADDHSSVVLLIIHYWS